MACSGLAWSVWPGLVTWPLGWRPVGNLAGSMWVTMMRMLMMMLMTIMMMTMLIDEYVSFGNGLDIIYSM